MPAPDLTVIVPVGPVDPTWEMLIDQLPPGWKVIVAAACARPEGVRESVAWHSGPAGRGRQLNAGAALADSHWLWFVHADSQLDAAVFEMIATWCAKRDRGLGYLGLEFASDGPGLAKLNAVGANLRSRLFGLPYGDQALCISAREFHQLYGFREDLERGEDLDFVVRARAAGLPATRIPGVLRTSARRYRDHGWLRTTWQHQINACRLIRDARASAQRQQPQ